MKYIVSLIGTTITVSCSVKTRTVPNTVLNGDRAFSNSDLEMRAAALDYWINVFAIHQRQPNY